MAYVGGLILRTRGGLTSMIRPPSGHLRQFRTKPRTKPRTKEETDASSKPVVEVEAGDLGPVGWSSLVRPTIFTLAFGGGTVSACAVWQYENMRHAALQSRVKDWWTGMDWGVKKAGGFREEMRQWRSKQYENMRHAALQSRVKDWWTGMDWGVKKAGWFREEMRQWWSRQNDGEKLFWPICFLNVVVYAAWKVPAFQGTMLKYFASNPGAKAACLPMLLSAFSHISLSHLGANMFVLHSFMSPVVELLGKEQFVAVYLSSAVVTSWASYVHKVATARASFSLGASGAIYTVLGLFCTLFPDTRMQIIFLPMFTYSAAAAIKGAMAMDGAGLVMGWRVFDHAAHLSGVLYGVFWCYFGQKMVWEKARKSVYAPVCKE